MVKRGKEEYRDIRFIFKKIIYHNNWKIDVTHPSKLQQSPKAYNQNRGMINGGFFFGKKITATILEGKKMRETFKHKYSAQ